MSSSILVRYSGFGGKLLGLGAVSVLAACVHSYGRLPSSMPPAGEAAPAVPISDQFIVRPGDELEIKMPSTPENNERGIVLPDGTMSLPLLGNVPVAGLSVKDLEARLEDDYATMAYVRMPKVTVFVRTVGLTRIYVGGAVMMPGALEFAGEVTVLQAIVRAQGPKDSARSSEVLVLRRKPDGTVAWWTVNITGVLTGTDITGDMTLASGDVVYVPNAPIGNVQSWVDNYIKQVLPLSPGLQVPVQ